jgi:4-hydroxy-tetrahydrodipicolinate reductase
LPDIEIAIAPAAKPEARNPLRFIKVPPSYTLSFSANTYLRKDYYHYPAELAVILYRSSEVIKPIIFKLVKMCSGGYILWTYLRVRNSKEHQMKPKLIVVGAAGRMGKRILALALEDGLFDIAGAVEKSDHPDIGKDAGLVASAAQINVNLDSSYPTADVVIDFSLPAAADSSIDHCAENGIALVLGTTGLSDQQREKINAASEKIPIVYATNMSIGMNLLFTQVGKVAAALGDDYDIEIVEQHHRFKKDAPSGSALTLAANICKAVGKKFPDSLVPGRAGKDEARKNGTIGIHAVRAGDITGKHEVIFSTLGETVTLSHTAHTRDTFARGALRAAQWLTDKKTGLYSMTDVLGIK